MSEFEDEDRDYVAMKMMERGGAVAVVVTFFLYHIRDDVSDLCLGFSHSEE